MANSSFTQSLILSNLHDFYTKKECIFEFITTIDLNDSVLNQDRVVYCVGDFDENPTRRGFFDRKTVMVRVKVNAREVVLRKCYPLLSLILQILL